jgi:lysine/ornithine N-monooxygenase
LTSQTGNSNKYASLQSFSPYPEHWKKTFNSLVLLHSNFREGKMQKQARVVIIGEGVVGASILYHLSKLGCSDAIMLERSELTFGST